MTKGAAHRIQADMRLRSVNALVIVATIWFVSLQANAACPQSDLSTDVALAIISDPQYLAHEPACVGDAIRYLGRGHVEAAIPKLVGLVDYAVATHCKEVIMRGGGSGCGPHGPFPWVKYPALDALPRFGKSAIPALIETLAKVAPHSVAANNAVFAFYGHLPQ